MAVQSIKCPNCGGGLKFDPELQKSKCEYCLSEFTSEELDKLIDYIVELFSNQFTRDDVYDGLASKDLLPTITKCINEVVGQMTEVTAGEGKND